MFVTCVVLVCQVQTAYKCVCDMCGVGVSDSLQTAYKCVCEMCGVGVSGADSLQVCL